MKVDFFKKLYQRKVSPKTGKTLQVVRVKANAPRDPCGEVQRHKGRFSSQEYHFTLATVERWNHPKLLRRSTKNSLHIMHWLELKRCF